MFTANSTAGAFGNRVAARIAALAAAISIVVGAGVLAPSALAHAVFSDRSTADHALACYSPGGGVEIVGMRGESAGSWIQRVEYASTSGIWSRSRTYDWTARSWSNWNNFTPMTPGYSATAPHVLRLLVGGYTLQVQYAKFVAGGWEYKTMSMKVLQVQNNNSTIIPYNLINDHSMTNAVCYQ